MELTEIITVDYSRDAELMFDEGHEWGYCAELYTDLFEQTMMSVLRGTDRDDVGGVIIYYRAGESVAWFDYENMWGGRYE